MTNLNAGEPGRMEPATTTAWVNTLSVRWQTVTALAILIVSGLLLWGVYAPFMHSLSADKLAAGDLFRDRAVELKTDTASHAETVEKLDALVKEVYVVVDNYTDWMSHGTNFDAANPMNRRVVESVRDLAPELRAMDETVNGIVSDPALRQRFSRLFADLARRNADINKRLDATLGQPLIYATYTEKYYSGLCYTALPDLLTILRDIRDLFMTESCFDQAVTEYIDAVGYDRQWPVARLHMADLYRQRDWAEFAMAEYLRVIKLDGNGEHGSKAFEEITNYQGRHIEADYYLAIAYLLREDEASALAHFRRFLGQAPTNVNAPKASELIRVLEEGSSRSQAFTRAFLRDEVWI